MKWENVRRSGNRRCSRGSESNIDTVLVLSGVTRAEDLASFPYQPKCVLNGVGDILKEKQERY